MALELQTLSGGKTGVSDEALVSLRSSLRGTAPAPGEAGYDEARTIWNAMVDVIADAIPSLPDPQSEIFIGHIGGAMARVASEATAFPQRASHFVMNVHTRWEDPAKDEACIGWARALFDRTSEHAAGTAYVNFMPADEAERLGGVYGDKMERLREVKARYDPENLFRVNHNIAAPVAQAAQ